MVLPVTVPLNVTVLEPAVNVPLLVQLPAILILLVKTAVRIHDAGIVIEPASVSVAAPVFPTLRLFDATAVHERVPLTVIVIPFDIVLVCAVERVKLLNVVFADPPIVCDEAPLKITVLEPAVNVPPLFVQSPAILIAVIAPADNVPAVIVNVPFNVRVVVPPAPLRVCPDLFTVRLLKVFIATEPLML
jgi:hypothetical protein